MVAVRCLAGGGDVSDPQLRLCALGGARSRERSRPENKREREDDALQSAPTLAPSPAGVSDRRRRATSCGLGLTGATLGVELETFIRREDAERFFEEVRGRRIRARGEALDRGAELEDGGRNNTAPRLFGLDGQE